MNAAAKNDTAAAGGAAARASGATVYPAAKNSTAVAGGAAARASGAAAARRSTASAAGATVYPAAKNGAAAAGATASSASGTAAASATASVSAAGATVYAAAKNGTAVAGGIASSASGAAARSATASASAARATVYPAAKNGTAVAGGAAARASWAAAARSATASAAGATVYPAAKNGAAARAAAARPAGAAVKAKPKNVTAAATTSSHKNNSSSSSSSSNNNNHGGTFEVGDWKEAEFVAALAALKDVDPETHESLKALRDLPLAGSYLRTGPEVEGEDSRRRPVGNLGKRPRASAVEEDDDDAQHRGRTLEETFLYGMPIPVLDKRDACMACDEPTTATVGCVEDVLLCDGHQCNREYHLGCCVPTLLEIPQNDWYCQDCNPEGSTSNLRLYFDHMTEQRGDADRVQHLLGLLRRDAELAGVGAMGIPLSEIEAAARYHHTAIRAIGDPPDDDYPRLPDDFFIGKPVRLYDDLHDHFHIGRIVDRRPFDAGDPDSEYLVRFLPGSDDRKEPAHHWLALEEHNLSVATTLVFVQQEEGNKPGSGTKVGPGPGEEAEPHPWVPALVWLRSTRALLSLHLLNCKFKTLATVSPPSAGKKKRGRPRGAAAQIWATVRVFGSDEFVECNLRTQAENFFGNCGKHLRTDRDRFRHWMALAESQAQERVQRWRSLRQQAPYHPLAIASRDEHQLGPLLPEGSGGGTDGMPPVPLPYQAPVQYSGLCPLVSRGLERVRLLEEALSRRGQQPHRQPGGEEPTKDAASTLRCRLVSLSTVRST